MRLHFHSPAVNCQIQHPNKSLAGKDITTHMQCTVRETVGFNLQLTISVNNRCDDILPLLNVIEAGWTVLTQF